MTNEQRLATMLATGIETDCLRSETWELYCGDIRPKLAGYQSRFISILTGNLVQSAGEEDAIDDYIASLPQPIPISYCLREARQRIADYKSTNGDVDKCLQLIEERKSE